MLKIEVAALYASESEMRNLIREDRPVCGLIVAFYQHPVDIWPQLGVVDGFHAYSQDGSGARDI